MLTTFCMMQFNDINQSDLRNTYSIYFVIELHVKKYIFTFDYFINYNHENMIFLLNILDESNLNCLTKLFYSKTSK